MWRSGVMRGGNQGADLAERADHRGADGDSGSHLVPRDQAGNRLPPPSRGRDEAGPRRAQRGRWGPRGDATRGREAPGERGGGPQGRELRGRALRGEAAAEAEDATHASCGSFL